MIPRAYLTEWQQRVPWALDQQVEQDLVISRVLVELFSNDPLSRALAFRGGTALHKLYFDPPERYSEDIDLVQIVAEPIGPTLEAIRHRLDGWLGHPSSRLSEHGATLRYRFIAETEPAVPMRLKLEINTREHGSVLGFTRIPFAVVSRWFSGVAQIQTYHLEELLGTKLRALYQRRKGRDVFDLARALQRDPPPDTRAIIQCFTSYLARNRLAVSRAEFEKNLAAKRERPEFLSDIVPLLPVAAASYDPKAGIDLVGSVLVALLPGEPWIGQP